MIVYQKLQAARVALQATPLKESGKNTFANYSYMELGDFLPQINAICNEQGLCGTIAFTADLATLTITNSDQPEEAILFTSPMAGADLKGCHAIQNLGATQTYLRRYLWVSAFEITEHDALDATTGKTSNGGNGNGTPKPEPKPEPKPPTTDALTDQQKKLIFARMKTANIAPERLKEAFGVESSSELKKAQVNEVLQWIDDTVTAAGVMDTNSDDNIPY